MPPPPTALGKIDFDVNAKRGVGRPRKYATPEEFEEQTKAYFDTCAMLDEPLTITGLALYMGFSSRKEYNDYLTYEGFETVATKAKAKVENGYEKNLLGGKPVGSIFALKNMGWRDEKQVDMKSSDGSMTPRGTTITIDTTKLTTDQLAAFWGAITVNTDAP